MIRKCILVIDDTPVQIRLLDKILSPVYDIKAATCGTKGIELANKHPIDLILLDIVMEGMSGFEVLSMLKATEKTKNIPVIFITSMDSANDEIKGLSAGVVDYITKPFVDKIVRLRVDLHMQLITYVRTIENLSLYDSLTGLQNRHSFNLAMKNQWETAILDSQCISMVMLDVDKFKDFNDKYGHLSGDICLKTVADALKASSRESDSMFRWGGEEFVVLLPDTPSESAHYLAERLRKAIEQTDVELEEAITAKVTVSLGVGTIYPRETDRLENFCNEVDKALYRAKENGRNRVEIAD